MAQTKRRSTKNKVAKIKSDINLDATGVISKATKNYERAKALKQLGSNLMKGTVNNAKNAFKTIGALTQGDWMDAGQNFVQGAKQYHDANVQSLKDIIGLVKALNHPEWYEKYGDRPVNLNFGQSNFSDYKGFNRETIAVSVPYIQTIPGDVNTKNTVDLSDVNPEAWRSAIQFIYSKLAGSNVSTIPFTTAQLELYLLAMRGILARYFYLYKFVATINRMQPELGNSPLSSLYGLGLLPTITELSKAVKSRAYCIDKLNFLSLQITSLLCLPPTMSLYDRDIWLSGNTFLDDSDIYKATEINFIPGGFYGPVPSDPNILGPNEWLSIGQEGLVVDDAIEELANYINVIANTGYVSEINSYLLKAYGDRAFITLPEINVNTTPVLVYDEKMLSQFKNATTYSSFELGDPSDYIYTDYNWKDYPTLDRQIEFFVSASGDDSNVGSITPLNTLVTTENSSVSSGQAMSLTAMCSGYTVKPGSARVKFVPQVHNTEIYLAPQYILSSKNAFGKITYMATSSPSIVIKSDFTFITAVVQSQCNGIPFVRIIDFDQELDNWGAWNVDHQNGMTWCDILGDPEIYATIGINDTQSLSRYRTLSLMKTIDIQDQNNYIASKR